MDSIMKKVDLATYKRRGMFEVFKERDIPFIATTSNVDITHLKRHIEEHKSGFFLSVSYLLSKTINLIPEFRHRIIDGELYEFSKVDPAFTVLMPDDTFSFCDSRHFDTFQEYRAYSSVRIQETRTCPDHSVGDKNHMFFITSVPWFSFTSIAHPYCQQYGTIPVVTIGKFFQQGDKWMMPVGLQVHHGVIDGFHLGRFYGLLEEMCGSPEAYLV